MDQLEQPDTPDSELPDTPADSDPHAPNAADVEQDGDEGAEQDEEHEEIEVDGRKFALPKTAAERLKSERMMQADYTQKTQAVAAQRQAVEAERVQFEQHKQTQQQFIKEVAKVEAINDQLAAYDKVDWQALIAENPQDAMIYQEQRRQLESQRNAAQAAVTQKQEQFALDEQQSIAKFAQEAEAYVAREVPGGAERQAHIKNYATQEGIKFDPAVAKVLLQNPALFKMMHKAELYDQLAKKQTAKPAPVPVPPPATRVTSSRPGAQRDPAKMSTSEWMASRNAQTRKSN